MSPPPPFQAQQPPSSFLKSLGWAWSGLLHTVVHQRNMRMHVLSAVLVGLVGSGVKLGLSEKVTLLFCVLLVIFAEMINSALEQLVDLAVQHFDERARLTKDIAAAAVLVLAVGTVVIFAAILVHDADAIFASPEAIERQVLLGAPLTFCAGALMHEQPRPGWVNAVLAVLALGFWAATLPASESSVFSAMTLGFLVICLGAGLKRASTR